MRADILPESLMVFIIKIKKSAHESFNISIMLSNN